MSNVFLSYARVDLAPVLAIEQGLRAAGVSVWRDQDKLYGGQMWPKALGEAIAAQDHLLLCCSKGPRKLGVRYESQHVVAMGFTLGFLHHPTYDWMVE